ncbi:hypothetical protein ACHAWF_017638 [Thalassiosira exigua]
MEPEVVGVGVGERPEKATGEIHMHGKDVVGGVRRRRDHGIKMGATATYARFAPAICLSASAALAFPIQQSTTWVTPRGVWSMQRPSFLSMSPSENHSRRLRMTSEENPDSADDDARTSRRPQPPENILSEFDPSIDWEPMDFDEIDSFFDTLEYPGDEYVGIDDPDEVLQEFDKETLLEILGLEDDGETVTLSDDDNSSMANFEDWDHLISKQVDTQTRTRIDKGIEDLEKALMGGVVPADAGVGSGILPGDDGFDPLEISTKDYFKEIQNFLLNLVPERKSLMDDKPEQEPDAGGAMPTSGFVGKEERPPALILRDYREAEIRHGRLAMLAAAIWPLQELMDRIFLPDSFGSMTVIYGGPTLPFFPLLMTFFMLNLGYLDIYSSEIKENESGDAFLPGECFWDPLCILEGAPDSMKRNMQEREILNGRAAMIAVAAYIFEEAMTHKPIVALPTNALLFEPAYQVPFIQQWLDCVAVGQCNPGL